MGNQPGQSSSSGGSKSGSSSRNGAASQGGGSRGSANSQAAVSLPETLWVQVVSAIGLPAGDGDTAGDEFSDPFCRVELTHGLNPRPLYTRRVPETLDPVWGESFTFELGHALQDEQRSMRARFGSTNSRSEGLRRSVDDSLPGGAIKLSVTVFDYDTGSSNDILGSVRVPLWQLPKDSVVDGWFPIAEVPDSALKARGSVRLRILRTADVAAASAEHARRVLRRARIETECLCRRLGERIALEEANRIVIPASITTKLSASLEMALGGI